MKLSKRVSKRVAFLASELALSIDQDERMALLTELLDELGINDQEQREDSKDSAARHLRYTAQQQRRKAARQADADHETRIDELYTRRDELLAQRAEQQPAPSPTPETPTVTEAADAYNVTAKMSKRLAAFDDMTDADQVDTLRGMWGAA